VPRSKPDRAKRQKEKRAKRQLADRKRAGEGFLQLGGRVQDRVCHAELLVLCPHEHSKRRTMQAVIDTGATGSCIRSDLAESLELPVIDRKPLRGIHGPQDTDIVVAELVVVGDAGKAAGIRRPLFSLHKDQMVDEMIFGMDLMTGGILTVDLVKNRWNWKLK